MTTKLLLPETTLYTAEEQKILVYMERLAKTLIQKSREGMHVWPMVSDRDVLFNGRIVTETEIVIHINCTGSHTEPSINRPTSATPATPATPDRSDPPGFSTQPDRP